MYHLPVSFFLANGTGKFNAPLLAIKANAKQGYEIRLAMMKSMTVS